MSDEPAWEPEPDGLDDELVLDDLDLLGELVHPTRSRIIRAMRQPRSVADVATQLEMPVTRLYHHVNRLEELGLIRVVATRRVAAVTERRYQVVAKSFRVDDALVRSTDRHELAVALGSVFDMAKLQFQREIETGEGILDDPDERKSIVSLGDRRLTEAKRDELIRRLKALVDEFASDTSDDDPDAIAMTVLIAAFPTTS